MAIKKQEFYEGAALHLLIRSGSVTSIRYDPPLFLVNNRLLVLLKYSTKGRSPWGFSFTQDEQTLLHTLTLAHRLTVGLICGSDGIAAIRDEEYRSIAPPKQTPVHISCYRQHREYYEINGPIGTLGAKVPPTYWQRILG